VQATSHQTRPDSAGGAEPSANARIHLTDEPDAGRFRPPRDHRRMS